MNRYGKLLQISAVDTVAVALEPIACGEALPQPWRGEALQDIPAGHKVAITAMAAGEPVIKYGYAIGMAAVVIKPGEHVHTHNVRTAISEGQTYVYEPRLKPPAAPLHGTFQGYPRLDGTVGVRNEIWVLPTVGCVNRVAQTAVERARQRFGDLVDGIHAFPHPYGCSQMGDDQDNTQRTIAALARHPNAAGALILGLGCENSNIAEVKKWLGDYDGRRIAFVTAQDEGDEIEAAVEAIGRLAEHASAVHREPCPLSSLVVGLKCGGSDGFSGITANPLVGLFSDRLVTHGGTTILTEVPEMFGAETILMNRSENKDVFDKTVAMINGFKRYFLAHGQTVYENPSPGNKAGGITTLEDKSLGCTQKAGSANVSDVLAYGEPVRARGLNLLTAPGNDLVASTALVASGTQIILFTTGRGTPWGCPVPTIKIATNSPLYHKKPNWMDFDAGQLLEGADAAEVEEAFFRLVLDVADGRRLARNEENGCREIAIFKDGVTL